MPFYWGIAADGTVAFSDDAKLLKQACGKSFAPFPQGILHFPDTDCSLLRLGLWPCHHL